MGKVWTAQGWVENDRHVEDPDGDHPEVAAAQAEREKAAAEESDKESTEDPREKASTSGRAASGTRKSTKQ